MRELADILRQYDIATDTLDVVYRDRTKTFYSLTVPFRDRAAWWYKLRALVEIANIWPVFNWNIDLFEGQWFQERLEASDEIITRGLALDPIIWLTRNNRGRYPDAEWLADEVADIHRLLIEHLRSVDAYDEEEDNRDPWEHVVAGEVTDPLKLADEYHLKLANTYHYRIENQEILLFPTSIPWHIPALTLFEPGNSGIQLEEHVCLHKRWAELYGAEVFEISRDSILMRSLRPPRDRDTARALAWEHITYCPDIDYPMLEAEAIKLYRGEPWSFWWD
jgi:hypothetical protein